MFPKIQAERQSYRRQKGDMEKFYTKYPKILGANARI